MDEERKQHATASLQALERLNLSSRNLPDTELKHRVHKALDDLRDIRAMVEGLCDDFVPLTVDQSPMTELKQLLLMHEPSSITDDARQKFSLLIGQALAGRCKKILVAMVMTCPWYAATQKERGERAKHNRLLVVVMGEDRHFLSPTNQHAKETGGVVDLGWLIVVEMFHFGHLLVKGRTRWVEAVLCPQQTLVICSEEWTRLRETLTPTDLTGLRGFLEACVNQAMGGISKKKKSGGMKLMGDATTSEICAAFRLLHHAHNHHLDLPPVSSGLSQSDLPDSAARALDKLKALYKEPDVSKEDIFQCLMTWHGQLKAKMITCIFTDQQKVVQVVGRWMMDTRLQGRVLPSATAGPEDSNSKLLQLMEEIGGPLVQLAPEQILLVARAGSFMYGLSTPESDVDYVVVYRETTEGVLGACHRLPECFESRGPTKMVEYGAYEARLLVYLGEHDYVSPHWKRLHDQRERFVTEMSIQQYLGLIKNNLNSLNRERRTRHEKKERKLFYQIFHKMDSIRCMMRGVAPAVRVTGPVRDFIMDVRTKPLEGDLSRESILKKATTEFEDLRQQLASRQSRLPERPDFRFVTDWIMSVRGDIFT